MDPPDDEGTLHQTVEAVALNHGPPPDTSSGPKDTQPADMLRIKQQMSNQCFEMAIQLQAAKSKLSCSTSEAERELSEYVNELERVKTIHFNSTFTLHRMQMWHAIGEKLKQTDSDALALKAETRDFQDEITKIQKKRLEMKRLTHEKMKEIDDLMSKTEHPDTEKYKAVLEKGQANLEKYKKMTIITQNVLRGILLACKVNWLDDPKLRDIAMTLEDFPISD
uniref:centromere protein H isoform X2 n=1 Tax=Gasterosteus aculeatus aculeatus TaxID=481459 RepID=UPI001A98A1E9|nr:centromere protein H isoform X2 [Gasterosteus aculeatus aculeatus]